MPRPGEPYYVTTPIYYVNGEPHLGHAYTTIAADVATRHARRCGADAFLLTGTDEHGQKVHQARPPPASRPSSGPTRSPSASASSPTTSRRPTTSSSARPTPSTRPSSRGSWSACESAAIYEGTYSGLYCTACEAFYTEDDLIDGRCPEHGTVPVFTEERNTFFRLSAYADALLERYAADPPFVLPQTRLNQVRSHVEGGLQDVSITRESVNWGVPLPWDADQAIYVWIDALINYTSALTYARPGEDLTTRLWPARWQLLGKDILRFHAVIWPAMLLSAGYELPRQLFIHGMLAGQDGHRMSKTRGNAMDYRPVAALYGPDALRYYLLREVAFGQDGGVGYAGMHERYHSDLANELGNLVSRSIAMVTRYRGGDRSRRSRRHPSWPRWRPRSRPPTTSASSISTSRARSSASGSSCARSTASSRRARPGSWPRARIHRPSRRSTRRWRRCARACACSRCCCGPILPSRAPLMLAADRRGGRRRGLRAQRARHRQRSPGRRLGRAALPARGRACRA